MKRVNELEALASRLKNDPNLHSWKVVDLARAHKCTQVQVKKARNNNPPPKILTFSATSLIVADPDLGKVPDREIASRYAVSRSLVSRTRTRRVK